MAHTTACTFCGTTFRVTAEQLLARDGKVRCGQCNQVFNAHLSLSLDYPAMPASAEMPVPEEAVSAMAFAAPAQPTQSVQFEQEFWRIEPEPTPEPEPEPITVLAHPHKSVPVQTPELAEAPPPEFPGTPIPDAEYEQPFSSAEPAPGFRQEPTFGSVPDFEPDEVSAPEAYLKPKATELQHDLKTSGEPDESLEALAQNLWKASLAPSAATPFVDEVGVPLAVESETRREIRPNPPLEAPPAPIFSAEQHNFRWLWMLGGMLLMLGLLAQGVYYFRAELATFNPALRPVLEQICAAFDCRVALPQNPDLLSIETSSLEADPNHAGIVVLHAVPRNRAPYPQAYPTLELTLTDYQNKLLVRRLFQPKEYLPRGAETENGMPPNEEIEVKLTIDLGETKAAGYRVYLFYPPNSSDPLR